MRLAGWTILLLLVLGLAAYLVKLRNDTLANVLEERPLEPGLSYAIGDKHVTEIIFSAADLKLYAFRWGPEHPFRIVVMRPRQKGIEECIGGEAFEQWFQMTTEMYIGAPLDDPIAAAPSEWAVLALISYKSVLEWNDTRLLLPSRPGQPIIAEWDGTPGQYPAEWDPTDFAIVKAGCARLGNQPLRSIE